MQTRGSECSSCRDFPALIGELESCQFISLLYAHYGRSNVTKLILNIGSLCPRCEIGDLVGVGDFANDFTNLLAKLDCPVLAIWPQSQVKDGQPNPADIWKKWASTVFGAVTDGGHLLPEDQPDQVLDTLIAFLSGY